MVRTSKEHDAQRRDIYTRFTGHTTAHSKQVVVHEVERKTGIAPPSWFNTGGMTISDAERAAAASRRSP